MTSSDTADGSSLALYWKVTGILVIIAYSLLSVGAVAHFISLRVRKVEKPRWTYIFGGLLTIGALLRIIYFALCEAEGFGFDESHHHGRTELSAQTNYLFNSVPSFLFFSAHLVLLFFWAEMYHSGFKKKHLGKLSMGRFLPIYVGINIFIYVSLIVLYILDFTMQVPHKAHPHDEKLTEFERVVQIIMCAFYVLLSFGFMVYGLLVLRWTRRYTTKLTSSMVKLGCICAATIVGFAGRATIIFFSLMGMLPYLWYMVLINWIIFEILPLSLVFVLLTRGTTKEQKSEGDQLLNADRWAPINYGGGATSSAPFI